MLDPNRAIQGDGYQLLLEHKIRIRPFDDDLTLEVIELNRKFKRFHRLARPGESKELKPARPAILKKLFHDGKRIDETSVVDFVSKHWSLDNLVTAQSLGSPLDLDNRMRNSNRWQIRGDKHFFLREGLRKAVTKIEVAASKHRALWWLKRKFDFPTEHPIRPNVSNENDVQDENFWGVCESEEGPIYELYPMIFGEGFDRRSDDAAQNALADILVRLHDASRALLNDIECKDLVESLRKRFGFEHTFAYLI